MIVRNEADIIRTALDSIVGLADEIVVLDTGSTDNTLEIAKDCGAKVFTGGDRMHKAESRNKCADHATGEWIVVLDADETVKDAALLKQHIHSSSSQAMYVKLVCMRGNNPTLSYNRMLIYKKGTFKYKYRAHEVPFPVNGWGKVEYTNFIFEHRPPTDRRWKLQYTLDRLLLDVKECPDEPRPLFYLGRQYVYLKDYNRAIETLEECLKIPDHYDKADAFHFLAICYNKLGQKDREIEALYQACNVDPMRWEWWGELATAYHGRGQNEIAVGVLRCMFEIRNPIVYADYFWRGYHGYDLMARCLWKLNRIKEGEQYARKALSLMPDNKRLQRNLQFFTDKLTGAEINV